MTFAFTYETPGTPELYAEVVSRIDAEPRGLIVRLATVESTGVRHTMVWASEADWIAFRTSSVEPAVASTLAANGIPVPDGFPPLAMLDVVDVEAPHAVLAATAR